jgi:hypothetical protein
LHETPTPPRQTKALVEDLFARGLDKEALLIVTGEFGRTPRINFDRRRATGAHLPG